jgi:hypothetical protein
MNAEDFPLIATNSKSPRALERFTLAVRDFDAGMNAKQIPNVTYSEAKEAINRAMDDAFGERVLDLYRADVRTPGQPDHLKELFFAGRPQLHTVFSWQKRMSKVPEDVPFTRAIRAFISEVLPLGEANAQLKTFVVKRVPKSVEEQKPRFVPRPSSFAAIDAVRTPLEAICESSFVQLRSAYAARYTHYQDRYFELQGNEEKPIHPFEAFMSVKRGVEPEAYNVVRKLIDWVDSPAEEQGPRRKPDEATIILDLAEQSAKEIRDSFINKNLRKLASIVEAKSNFERVEVVSHFVNLGGLTGSIRLSFKDGSAFTAQNSVVVSHSPRGVRFLRFPLTFHDVIRPDGLRFKTPSEEKMNKEFAGRFYGTVTAPESERDLLSSLGLRLGAYDAAKGFFLAEATHQWFEALASAEGLSREFKTDLHLRVFKPIDEMSLDELMTEKRWLDWAISTRDPALLDDVVGLAPELDAQIAIINKANAFANVRAQTAQTTAVSREVPGVSPA